MEENIKKDEQNGPLFKVEDKPPAQIVLFYSFQVTFSIIAGPLGACYIIYSNVCAEGHEEVLAQLISTSLFMVGIATFLQVTFGVRLPITQGSSYLFFPCIIAMMHTEEWKCPDLNEVNKDINSTYNSSISLSDDRPWRPRIALISGSLAVASLLQIALGCFGLIGFMMRYVGPLTVTPTVALIGIVYYGAINHASKHNWGLSLLTSSLIIIFAFIIGHKPLPLPSWSKEKGFHVTWFPLISIFSNILAMFLVWFLCWILTVAGVFTDNPKELGYLARTDAKIDAMKNSPWIFFPYPGQWGPLTMSPAVLVGFFASTLGTIIESIGDYYATARVCHVPPPPKHASNRGIAMEGFAGMLGGIVGACHPTTSYSNVMGFIAYTGMSSRVTWQAASVVFILGGLFGKFGAFLAMAPDPIVGGVMLVGLGMCFSIAITNLEHVDMKSGRNQMILGVSVTSGVAFPMFLLDYPNAFDTGSSTLDQVLYTAISNGPLVGGVLGCLLDNVIPGSKKERGLAEFHGKEDDGMMYSEEEYVCYDLPYSHILQRSKFLSYLPFMPTYQERDILCCKTTKSNSMHNVNINSVCGPERSDGPDRSDVNGCVKEPNECLTVV